MDLEDQLEIKARLKALEIADPIGCKKQKQNTK